MLIAESASESAGMERTCTLSASAVIVTSELDVVPLPVLPLLSTTRGTIVDAIARRQSRTLCGAAESDSRTAGLPFSTLLTVVSTDLATCSVSAQAKGCPLVTAPLPLAQPESTTPRETSCTKLSNAGADVVLSSAGTWESAQAASATFATSTVERASDAFEARAEAREASLETSSSRASVRCTDALRAREELVELPAAGLSAAAAMLSCNAA